MDQQQQQIENELITPSMSDYKAAKERFYKAYGSNQATSHDNHLDFDEEIDNIIAELCNGNNSIEIGNDSSLFYDLLLRADFFFIERESMETFYCNLFDKFIFTDLIDDIIRNMSNFDYFAYAIRTHLLQAFCKMWHIEPVYKHNTLLLRYHHKKLWHELSLQKVYEIEIQHTAIVGMYVNQRFNMKHLNFLMRLFDIKKVILVGADLSDRWEEVDSGKIKSRIHYLFEGLKLESLTLQRISGDVNEVILRNISGILDHLTDLNVAQNYLSNKTFEKIRGLPLKRLNMCFIPFMFRTITTSRQAKEFVTKKQKTGSDIDLLWEDGILRDTIQHLDIGFYEISWDSLTRISNLKELKELDISGSLKGIRSTDILLFKNLKVLRMKKNMVCFDEFRALCELKLDHLEFDYYSSSDEDFSAIQFAPLTETLTELSLGIFKYSEPFMKFVSNLKLTFFECEIESTFDIGSFICNYPEERKYLETLKLEGSKLYLSESFFFGLKQLNLKKLSLEAKYEDNTLSKVCFLENLQQSVEELTIKYFKCLDHLHQLLKFKKLKILVLRFDQCNEFSKDHLQELMGMETLEEIHMQSYLREKPRHKIGNPLIFTKYIAPVGCFRI